MKNHNYNKDKAKINCNCCKLIKSIKCKDIYIKHSFSVRIKIDLLIN